MVSLLWQHSRPFFFIRIASDSDGIAVGSPLFFAALVTVVDVRIQKYTVFQKKVHPYDFHDNNVKWKPIKIIFGRNVADKICNSKYCVQQLSDLFIENRYFKFQDEIHYRVMLAQSAVMR